MIVDGGPLPRLIGVDAIESQLRRARSAGAGHAVIFAERVTNPLLAAIDRLRRDGLSVDLARSVSDAADFIHPDEAILLINPKIVVTGARLESIAHSNASVLLCVHDDPANEQYERIDATARWTGYARLDGRLLRRTAAMVGDWDLASTLMRQAVQEGAARVTLTSAEADRDLLSIDNGVAAHRSARRLVADAATESAGWGTRWIVGPIARLSMRVAADLNIEAQWITLAALGFFGLSGATALAGWVVASLLMLLLGQILDLAGSVGTQATAGTARFDRYRFPARFAAAVVVIGAMGITLSLRSAQWGCAVLAIVIIGATLLAAPLARQDLRMELWRSDPTGHTLIGLAGFALNAPVWALVVGAIHAAVSLGWAVHKLTPRLARS